MRNVHVSFPPSDDEARMQNLYAAHARPLLYFLLGLLPESGRHTAEDLLQETMVRAWRNLDSMPTESRNERRWLLTVARRLTIDAHRRRQVRPVEVRLVAETDHRSPAEDDTFETVLTTQLMRHALGQLSSAHRAVITELHVRGCSVNEAAARLGIPTGTVKSRHHRALRLLHQALRVTD